MAKVEDLKTKVKKLKTKIGELAKSKEGKDAVASRTLRHSMKRAQRKVRAMLKKSIPAKKTEEAKPEEKKA